MDDDDLVQPQPWEVRRHRVFADGRLLGRIWIDRWLALEVGLGVRLDVATVNRNAADRDMGLLAYAAFTFTP